MRLAFLVLLAASVQAQPVPIGGLSAVADRVAYPEAARLAGAEGIVTVEVDVGDDGRPCRVRVADSPDARLDVAALDAVRATLFNAGPGRVRLAVPVRMQTDGAPRLRPFADRVVEIGGTVALWRDWDSVVPPPRYDRRLGNAVVAFTINAVGAATDVRAVAAPSPTAAQTFLDAVRRTWFDPGDAVGRRVALSFNVLPPHPMPPPRDTTDTFPHHTEVLPVLVGGLDALRSATVYPEGAIADGVEGRVIVQFIIQADGSVADLTEIRSPDARLTAAAFDAIRAVTFAPGQQRGRPVAVRFAVPVTFRLPAPETL